MNENPQEPGPETQAENESFLRDAKRVLRKAMKRSPWFAVVGIMLFNERAQRMMLRYLRAAWIGGIRMAEGSVNLLVEALAIGYALMEFKWVGLTLLALGIHWFFDWGPVMLVFFAFGLWMKHVEKSYMMARVQDAILASGLISAVGELDFSPNPRKQWASIKKALEAAKVAMPAAAWEVIHKLMNEGHYFTWALIICIVTFHHATGLPWLTVTLQGLAALALWEVNTTIGNNRDAEGNSVLEAKEYDVLRRQVSNRKVAFGFGKGRKFELPITQVHLRGLATLVIVGVTVYSWAVAYIYRHDYDHDGLTNYDERVVFNTNWRDRDTDDNGVSDGEEVKAGFINPVRDTLRVDNPQRIEEMRRRAQYERDHQLWVQAVRDTARWKADSLKAKEALLSKSDNGGGSSSQYQATNIEWHNFWTKVRHAGMRKEMQTVVGLILLVAVVLLVASGFTHMFSSWWALVGAIAIALIVGGLLAALGMPAAMIGIVLGAAVCFGLWGAYHRRQSTAH